MGRQASVVTFVTLREPVCLFAPRLLGLDLSYSPWNFIYSFEKFPLSLSVSLSSCLSLFLSRDHLVEIK